MEVSGKYQPIEMIGSGSSGTVWKIKRTDTNQLYACKVIPFAYCLQPNFFPHLVNELRAHAKIRYPGVTRLYDIMIDNQQLYCVIELCEGDLSDLVRSIGSFNERQAMFYFYQIMKTVAHIHKVGFAHRDLKLENVLYVHDPNCPGRMQLKLTDFGLCRPAINNRLMTTRCGTFFYCAPEMFSEQPYDGMKCDIWSAGVMLFTIVTGRFPWEQNENLSEEDQFNHAIEQICSCHIEYPDTLSYPLVELISQMLTPDPRFRPDAEQVLEHPWFSDLSEEEIAPYDREYYAEDYVAQMVNEAIEGLTRCQNAFLSSQG
ncbi:CAMK family protein kinase [Histomonas meleagridis]|uniref:CAMK family protein kinase n=1 Tax=Histomonas meleagridis TaxID=135588 RepID=UPI003559E822|nr:CAMK family protein kinase [Histomonas meleagridis]KAH0802039.1 CAMK family protein kinase [Histomonas meleagridis]